MSTLNTYHFGLLLLRVVSASMLLYHGIQKIEILTMDTIAFSDPLGIGSVPSLILTLFAEVVCTILVIIGFKTRWFSVPIIIFMIVAAFVVHGADPFAVKEKALLYLVIFTTLFLTGGGKYVLKK